MPQNLTLPLMLVALFGAMWWMSRRNRKQQESQAAFRDNLQPGQEVMTIGGLYGTVVSVDGDVITLEISPGVTSRWTKPAIKQLVESPVGDATDDDVDAEDWDEDEWDDEWEDTDEVSDDESDEDAGAEDGDADNRRG